MRVRLFVLAVLFFIVAAAIPLFAAGEKETAEPGKVYRIAFIPKIIGENFFTQAGNGAKAMGDMLGVEVTYDGPSTASVSGQVQFINSAVSQGYDAISISSVSPDGLNPALDRARKAGLVVLTWDSDVNPDYRQFYIDQGTPDQLGRLLVDMVKDDVGEEGDVAFFYSSPTVTDQNQWVVVAKSIIKNEYPGWSIVTTQYGEMKPDLSLTRAENIYQTYPDLDGIICPDSTAFPAAAKAAENTGVAGKVAITGFTTPSVIKPYILRGTVKNGGLWDCRVQGALSIYVAKLLLDGKELKVGDEFDVPDVPWPEGGTLDMGGSVKVRPNSDQGYDKKYDRPDSGIIVLPERLVFTKDNVEDYNF